MSNHCPNLLHIYEIPGSLRACSGEAGHDGECVFDRTPSQEELARHVVTWSVPVPDPTNERIKELENKYVLERNRVRRFRKALKEMALCIKGWKVSFKNERKKVSRLERIKELEREVAEWREIAESLLNALDACPYCLTPKGKPHTCKLAPLLEKP